jgi:endonuclease-3 related protein
MPPLRHFYERLLQRYGPQGWWPLATHAGVNPTKTGAIRGYHPGDYSFPHTEAERFEIACGAILTQNTAWPNAEKALLNLHALGALTPDALPRLPQAELLAAVRPAGYYNAKASKLLEFCRFFSGLDGSTPSREALLAVWGVGPETADSIRLYAYGEPEMIVDAYTRRFLFAAGLVAESATYDAVKAACVAGLPRRVKVYQEFHALLVEHGKRHYSGRNPPPDPLLNPFPAEAQGRGKKG